MGGGWEEGRGEGAGSEWGEGVCVGGEGGRRAGVGKAGLFYIFMQRGGANGVGGSILDNIKQSQEKKGNTKRSNNETNTIH